MEAIATYCILVMLLAVVIVCGGMVLLALRRL